MSGVMKVILLLAVVAVMTKAQSDRSGSQCMCSTVRNSIRPKLNVVDIKMYPATVFCNKAEIVVTFSNARSVCLDPKSPNVQKFIARVMKQGDAATTPSVLTSSAPASSTADSL